MLYDLYFMNLWQQISTFCLIPVGSTLFCIVLLLLLHWVHVHVSYEQIGIFCVGKWIWPDAPKPIKRTKPTIIKVEKKARHFVCCGLFKLDIAFNKNLETGENSINKFGTFRRFLFELQ